MAGPQFSPEWSTYGGNLPSPNDNDGCFPLGMGSGFRGTISLRCLVRQVPHLAHKRPGVESGSSSSRSLSSIPDDSHVIVRTDNMAVVSRINRQGGSRSRTLNRHARQLLVWAQDKFLSLREVHVPQVLNLAADFLSRQKLRSGEWMLNRRMVDQIWERFGKAEVDLFASQESTQCPLRFSLSHPMSLGIDVLARPCPDMKLYAFPPVKLILAVLRRVKTCGLRLLVAPFWPSQRWLSELISLLEGDPWEISVRKDLLY